MGPRVLHALVVDLLAVDEERALPALAEAAAAVDVDVDVSFPALKDKAELAYLNQQPTSFALPAEAVDRLRAAAGAIIGASPDFERLLKDAGVNVVGDPATAKTATATAP